jgi:hypothetical protein
MNMADGFGLRPVRDIDRLPSMLPGLQTGVTSQPESPTTPGAPARIRPLNLSAGRGGRPSIRQQQSMSGDSDDANGEDMASDESAGASAQRNLSLIFRTAWISRVWKNGMRCWMRNNSLGLAAQTRLRARKRTLST